MTTPHPKFDVLLPAEMALKAEEVGVGKAGMDAGRTFVLSVLAGAFISLGAVFSTTVVAGTSAAPFGWSRAVAGVAFSLGLLLVVLGGAACSPTRNGVHLVYATAERWNDACNG